MNAFGILVLAHLVGDFLLQTQWMAFNKQKHFFPLLVHSSVYTLVVLLASLFLLEEPLSWIGIAIIFAGHLVLDQGAFVRFWYAKVTRCTEPSSGWLKIIYDQIFHLLLLYAALMV